VEIVVQLEVVNTGRCPLRSICNCNERHRSHQDQHTGLHRGLAHKNQFSRSNPKPAQKEYWDPRDLVVLGSIFQHNCTPMQPDWRLALVTMVIIRELTLGSCLSGSIHAISHWKGDAKAVIPPMAAASMPRRTSFMLTCKGNYTMLW
jgi:hypothetical protein